MQTPKRDNTFCWYPFHQLALKEWRQGRGIMNAAPCCNSIRPETPDPLNVKQKLKEQASRGEFVTAKEIFHSETMSELRQYMLEGKRHPACETCWKIEDRADPDDEFVGSYRLMSCNPGRLRDDPEYANITQEPELRTIDFAFGENCNLRCRMCVPGLSNKLREDFKYFYNNQLDTSGIRGFDSNFIHSEIMREEKDLDDPRKPEDIWASLADLTLGGSDVRNFEHGVQWQDILDNIHELRHIKATGGETLVSKPFEEFLDTAIERGVAKDIFIEFHTNATKFSDTMLNKLMQFDSLHLNLSIDSIGKNYEYIRYPMPWEKLDLSLRNLLTKTNGKYTPCGKMPYIRNFSFNVVLSALNAHYLKDLCEYQDNLYQEYGCWPVASTFYVDLLWPEDKFINVKFLSPKIKKDLIKQFKSIKAEKTAIMLDTAINFLQEYADYDPSDTERQNMLREITLFDASRNQSYRDYLHEDIVEFLETPR
jgi:hypothetical protein